MRDATSGGKHCGARDAVTDGYSRDGRGFCVGTLDKFSAIGSFDADSSSAPPSTCVQIEGFRESCDIPSRRRCGKDRENVKNEEICGRKERES